MVDEQPPTQPEPTDGQASLLPTQNASQFAITMTPAELLISLGHTRVAISQGSVGAHFTPESFVEWLWTISISPVAAVKLSERLRASIVAYEKQFGKIPADASFSVKPGP
jgi:hypothetical protein